MSFLASRWDEDEVKLRAFPLVMREKAKIWFQGLTAEQKVDWATLKESFLTKYVTDNTPEKLLQKLTCLQQDNLALYLSYEAQLMKLWIEWEASLERERELLNFSKRRDFWQD